MPASRKKKEVLHQPGDCVSYRLRRAARKAAVYFDSALKPAGLRNTQFTLLSGLDLLGAVSIGVLAEELATDSTTLNRNLAVLVRRGLVEDISSPDARVRNIRLTRQGRKTFVKALPLWQAAQKQVLESIDAGQWSGIQSNLRKIETACEVS